MKTVVYAISAAFVLCTSVQADTTASTEPQGLSVYNTFVSEYGEPQSCKFIILHAIRTQTEQAVVEPTVWDATCNRHSGIPNEC